MYVYQLVATIAPCFDNPNNNPDHEFQTAFLYRTAEMAERNIEEFRESVRKRCSVPEDQTITVTLRPFMVVEEPIEPSNLARKTDEQIRWAQEQRQSQDKKWSDYIEALTCLKDHLGNNQEISEQP